MSIEVSGGVARVTVPVTIETLAKLYEAYRLQNLYGACGPFEEWVGDRVAEFAKVAMEKLT